MQYYNASNNKSKAILYYIMYFYNTILLHLFLDNV